MSYRLYVAGLLSCVSFIPAAFADPVIEVTKGSTLSPVSGAFYDPINNPFAGSLTAPSILQIEEKIARTPGAVKVIPAEHFEKSFAVGLKDMIGDTPGIYVQQRYAEETRLSIRGSGIGRSFHMRGITLLQDGVPINFSDNSADFQEIDPETIRAIEVYKGANGLQYGASSLGGAVNIITPTGITAPNRNEIRFTAGDNDTFRTHASVARVVGKSDVYAAVTGVTSSGWRDQSAQETGRLNANFGYRLNDTAETRFYIGYNNINQEVPGALPLSTARRMPKTAPGFNTVNDNARDIRSIRLANKTSFVFARHQVDLGVYGTHKELFHPIFQVLDQTSETIGSYARVSRTHTLLNHKNTYTLGTNLKTGKLDALQFINMGGSRGAQTADSDQRASQADIYGENQFSIIPDVALITGLQAVYATRDFKNNYNPAANAEKDYTALNPKFGVLWDVLPSAQVFSNISRSSEAPTYSELVQQPVVGFVPLEDQKAWTLEMGTRGNSGRMAWDLAAYHARVRDELLNFTTSPLIPAASFNANKTVHQGIEAGLDFDIGKDFLFKDKKDRLLLRQVYTLNDFKFDGDTQFGNNRIAGVPMQVFHTELRYQNAQGWEIAPNIEWIPEGGYVDHANTLKAPGYAVFGAKASYKVREGLDVFIDGRNLTDKHYISDYAAITNAATANTSVFYPGEGRRVFAGVKIAF